MNLLISASGLVQNTQELVSLFNDTSGAREAVKLFGEMTCRPVDFSKINRTISRLLRDYLITALCTVSKLNFTLK